MHPVAKTFLLDDVKQQEDELIKGQWNYEIPRYKTKFY